MKILFYALLGVMLGVSGISVIDDTLQFVLIMLLVVSIDMHTFYTTRG